MIVNDSNSGDYKYILQVQYGPIAMKGTWFTYRDEYREAFREFLDVIDEDRAIAISDEESGMSLFIHIGPGMVVMFLTEEMYESMKMKQQLAR